MPRLNQKELILALSDARLQPYGMGSTNLGLALKNYQNNIRLSQALYALLQQFEVVLRNRIEEMLITKYGLGWFNDQRFTSLLDHYGNNKIQETINTLHRSQKTINSGAIVAEMTFGFWIALLGRKYRSELWDKHNKIIFPFATSTQRDLGKIYPQLQRIRDLRNRIAHHEAIWQDTQLLQKYQSIKQLLTWMNPHAALWLERCRLDQFSKVHSSIFGKTP